MKMEDLILYNNIGDLRCNEMSYPIGETVIKMQSERKRYIFNTCGLQVAYRGQNILQGQAKCMIQQLRRYAWVVARLKRAILTLGVTFVTVSIIEVLYLR